jgi:hypothetical protein
VSTPDPRAIAAPYEEIAARTAATMARLDDEFRAEREDIAYYWEREEAKAAAVPEPEPEIERTARRPKRPPQPLDPSETGYYSSGWLS